MTFYEINESVSEPKEVFATDLSRVLALVPKNAAPVVARDAGTTTTRNLYATAAGGTPLTQPILTVNGRIEAYVQGEAPVDLLINYGLSNQYTQRFSPPQLGPTGPAGSISASSYAAVTGITPVVGTNSSSTDRANIQAAVDAMGSGGTVQLGGVFDMGSGTVTIPTEKAIRLLGADMTMGAAGTGGTRLLRTAGSNPVVSAVGPSFGSRCRVSLECLTLDGGARSGTVLTTHRISDSYFHRLRVMGSTTTGWHVREAFNCTADNYHIASCGDGVVNPAMLFDAFAEAQGASDTFTLVGGQFEGNGGIELLLTGDTTNGAPSNQIQFIGTKMEAGTAGSIHSPFIALPYAQSVRFSDLWLTMSGQVRDVPMISQATTVGSFTGSNAGTLANSFRGLQLGSLNGTGPAHLIETSGTNLSISDWIVGVGHAMTAVVKINSTQAHGSVQATRPNGTLTTEPLFNDLRSGHTPALVKSLNPRGRAYLASAYSVPNAAWTRIPLDSLQYDTDAIWDSANTRYKIRTPGPYRLAGQVFFGADGTGSLRLAAILVNGLVRAQAETRPNGALAVRANASCDFDLEVNDTVELVAYQDRTSGTLPLVTTIDVGSGAAPTNWLSVTRTG